MKKFTKDHEWIETSGDSATVGISDYAQKQLGDVVYVSLTKKINDTIKAGEPVAEIESVKSVSEIYAPVDGTITEFNKIFDDESKSGIVNQDPYGQGWIFKMKINEAGQLNGLLDESKYEEYIGSL